MARADLLESLVEAGSGGDLDHFRRTLSAIIAEERGKQHYVLADRLERYLSQARDDRTSDAGPALSPVQSSELWYEQSPRRQLSDLILPPLVERIVREVVTEHHRSELLAAYGLEPRHRLLFMGPPGNGKTTLAEALAEALAVPIITLRYEGVIGSYLGETANRLRRVFEYVRTRPCVFFIDEFDTLGKERGDPHDTGEIKRVVSSLLLQIDDLPSHVVVVTATNHPELLDRAVWRRFEIRLTLPPPDRTGTSRWLSKLERESGIKLAGLRRNLSRLFAGASYSDLGDLETDIRRHLVLRATDESPTAIVADRLALWQHTRDTAGVRQIARPSRNPSP